MLAAVTGRLYLYGTLLFNMVAWAAQQALDRALCRRHPLNWPADQDFNIMMLKTLFTRGTYVHWRNFTALWAMLNGKAEERGLLLERVAPDALGVPGCRSSWWISLDPALLKDAPPAKASCVLMFLHGGAFLAGDPRMYCPAFRCWMQQLAAQGIRMQVLSVGYPLAPENPFPAAVLGAAAGYRWLLEQLKLQGRSDTTVIVGGDSAGGNLVATSLAYLRDGTLHSPSAAAAAAAAGAPKPAPPPPPPAGALLISPAVDFTSSSVFRHSMESYFAALQSQQQQGKASADVQVSQLPPAPQPPGSEWDYVTVAEGPAVAQLYVQAQSAADMAQPLVSPACLSSFKGLVQGKVLVLWGGVEVMGPDIAVFAGRMRADGVAVEVHEEANEPHVFCVLPFEGALQKGAKVVVPFLASCCLNKA